MNQESFIPSQSFQICQDLKPSLLKMIEMQGLSHLKYQTLYPANTKLAALHRQITKFGEKPQYFCKQTNIPGQYDPFTKGDQIHMCPCCLLHVCNRQIALCYPTQPKEMNLGQQKYKLGSGVSLFFFFIKMCIYYLIMRFVLTDGLNIFTSIFAHYCFQNKTKCMNFYNSNLSGYNKHSNKDQLMMQMVDFMNLILTFVTIAFFIYNRKVQYNMFQLLEETDITDDDFSLLVESIPKTIFQKNGEFNTFQLDLNYETHLSKIFNQKLQIWLTSDPEKDQLLSDLFEVISKQKKQKEQQSILGWLLHSQLKQQKQKQPPHKVLNLFPKFSPQQQQKKNNQININDYQRSSFDFAQFNNHLFRDRNHFIHKLNHGQSKISEDNYLTVPQTNQSCNTDKKWKNHHPNIVHISLCYDLTELQNLQISQQKFVTAFMKNKEVSQQMIDMLNNQLDELQVSGQSQGINELNYRQIFIKKLYQKIQNLQNRAGEVKKIKQIQEHFRIVDQMNCLKIQLNSIFSREHSSLFNQTKFVGKAFITFQYQHMRQYFLRQFTQNPSFMTINDQPLKLVQPPQPADVFWYNLKISNRERNKSILFSAMVLLMCIGFSFICVIYIEQKQIKIVSEREKHQNFKQTFISNTFNAIMSLITVFINALLSYIIQQLTDLQKPKTQTKRISSLIIKNVIAQFTNTCVIYYIINLFNKQIGPLQQNGMVSKILFLVGIGAIITIILNILQITSRASNWIKMILCELHFDQTKKFVNQVQFKLNRQCEYPDFKFVNQYTFYLVQLYLGAFYSLVAPVVIFFLIPVFIVQYWVDKYNLFRKCSVHRTLNLTLFQLIIFLFQFSLFFDTIGNIIFDEYIYVKSEGINKTFSYISLGVTLSYLSFVFVFPHKMKAFLLKKNVNFDFSYYRYLQNNTFTSTFWSENPATELAFKNLSRFYNKQEDKFTQKLRLLTKTTDIIKYSKIDPQSLFVDRYKPSEVRVYHQYFK